MIASLYKLVMITAVFRNLHKYQREEIETLLLE